MKDEFTARIKDLPKEVQEQIQERMDLLKGKNIAPAIEYPDELLDILYIGDLVMTQTHFMEYSIQKFMPKNTSDQKAKIVLSERENVTSEIFTYYCAKLGLKDIEMFWAMIELYHTFMAYRICVEDVAEFLSTVNYGTEDKGFHYTLSSMRNVSDNGDEEEYSSKKYSVPSHLIN